ncbi:MAG: DEAD/DEAH box helicase family protein, partial [Salinibacterium sp.]|nr:DEAD/DEAH box helicase family protein [Salinibacterium sp.]
MAETVAQTPALAALWDADKNSQAADAVPARNFRSAWWRCPQGHSFQRAPRMMLRDSSCPTCGVASTSFATEHPHLVKLWHPSKNSGLEPAAVDSRHAAELWWQCERGHAFRRAPLQMGHDASCPTCALAEVSLAARFPTIAAEWHPERNGDITPEAVDADHQMNAWWRCERGHEFQATVRSRCRANRRCPVCYGSWSVEHLRTFVKALLGHVDALNPSEMFALAMQAGALSNRASRAFVMALTTGRFPTKELERFAEGKPSLVDEFADDKELTLDLVDAREAPASPPASDPYALPAAPVAEAQESAEIDVDVSAEVELRTQASSDDDDDELPVIQARDALAALDSDLVANADAETVKFLIDSAKAKLWRHAYLDAEEARSQAAGFKGDVFSSAVRDNFLGELDAAMNLPLPTGYSFRPTPQHEVTKPLLMQRHVAVSVLNSRRFGNWSGMGAGKTLSAALATRVVDAKLTVICCPNAVVDNWEAELENAFPRCEVAKKTWSPEWSHPLADAPRYLVMNYEQFQQPDSESKLVGFLERNVVDFVVIDEIHYAKQRDAGATMSRRKKLVQGLVLESGKKNPDLCVLGMSGTPVINTLQEGKSLIEMITGHRHDDLDTRATVQNCMRLYQRLVTLGTRYRPPYHMQLDEGTRPEVDCGPYLDEIRESGRGSVLKLEQVLTRVRLPVIVQHLHHGEKAIVYTHYVDGIVDQLREAIADAGFRVGLCIGGVDNTDLDEFKRPNGEIDVLVASSRIATGVDGLQHVCNKLIINALPWTNAEYEQLRGRLWRQGSKFDRVTVVIPVTYAVVNGERWSYCESKLHRLEYKKSIADAAVDGVVPEGNLRTPAQAQQDIMNWLGRLESGEIQQVVRPEIKIPLSGEPSEVTRRVRTYGDFTRVNNRWYMSSSKLTHARLSANPEEWA